MGNCLIMTDTLTFKMSTIGLFKHICIYLHYRTTNSWPTDLPNVICNVLSEIHAADNADIVVSFAGHRKWYGLVLTKRVIASSRITVAVGTSMASA